jgi:hypothetical protein
MSSHTEAIESGPMLRDVLSGALRLWDVAGTVEADEDGFIVTAGGAALRILRRAPRGWLVIQAGETLGEHAGVSGLLRHLREELAPHAKRGRLIIGTQ